MHGCGFVFPDDEAHVQAEFERNLPFARSVAARPPIPTNPKSVLGIETKPFYIKSDDPYKEGLPGADSTSSIRTAILSRCACSRSGASAAVTLKYRINGGAEQSAPTSEWGGGERYKPADVYYHECAAW